MKTFPKFNDGVAYIYREKGRNTNFNAKVNAKEFDDLDFVCKLDFEQMSKREQDQEFANQSGHSLSMKIRTRYVDIIDNKCKVVIDSTLYDIYDIDKTRTELYLYLEEERKIVT
jgi:SPP1 family predicted phage head-tail adaptor